MEIIKGETERKEVLKVEENNVFISGNSNEKVWLETADGIPEQQEVRKEGSVRNTKEIAETDQNGLIVTRSHINAEKKKLKNKEKLKSRTWS